MKLRQQYHFRESEKGLLAWDVLKLIKLSSGFEVKEVLLTDISELEESFWYNDGEVPTTKDVAEHAKLIMNANLSFPIILCSDGRVMDGMHRVGKAYIMGKATIKVVQFSNYVEPDYIGKEPDELPY